MSGYLLPSQALALATSASIVHTQVSQSRRSVDNRKLTRISLPVYPKLILRVQFASYFVTLNMLVTKNVTIFCLNSEFLRSYRFISFRLIAPTLTHSLTHSRTHSNTLTLHTNLQFKESCDVRPWLKALLHLTSQVSVQLPPKFQTLQEIFPPRRRFAFSARGETLET
jgi:hypothetical protein